MKIGIIGPGGVAQTLGSGFLANGAIGSKRVGVKFSPAMPFNDIQEPDADEVYTYKARRADYLAAGKADAIAYGVKFLSNPDLPARLASDAELNHADPSTFYDGDEKGYIDYPVSPRSANA